MMVDNNNNIILCCRTGRCEWLQIELPMCGAWQKGCSDIDVEPTWPVPAGVLALLTKKKQKRIVGMACSSVAFCTITFEDSTHRFKKVTFAFDFCSMSTISDSGQPIQYNLSPTVCSGLYENIGTSRVSVSCSNTTNETNLIELNRMTGECNEIFEKSYQIYSFRLWNSAILSPAIGVVEYHPWMMIIRTNYAEHFWWEYHAYSMCDTTANGTMSVLWCCVSWGNSGGSTYSEMLYSITCSFLLCL